MMAAGNHLPPGLHTASELDHVFWHFFTKFQRLPTPRSVAEARVSAHELEFLTGWLIERGGWARHWCERTWQDTIEGDLTASDREMFGALFLIFASEVIRDQCNEESMWPAISKPLRANKNAYTVLFDANGQPSANCKDAIAAGARKLDLRNLIDRYGKQEYFDTLKLQIGFTFKGATNRLPDWLDGLGQPTAVRMLTGELQLENLTVESSSFAELWTTLRDYRRSRVSGTFATDVLESSPWLRPEWIPELIKSAKLRPRTAPVESAEITAAEPLCEPILRWDYPAKPALFLRLNEEQVSEKLGGRSAATFVIDRQVVDRWTAREDGGWNGKRELPCQPEGAGRPNLRPGILTITSGDEPVDEIDLSELGLSEPLLLFDLGTGRVKDPATLLDRNREYGALCDPNMEVTGAQLWKGKDRIACLLSTPITQEFKISCAGAPFWEPNIANIQPQRSFRLSLESLPGEVVEIETAAHIEVKGVPEDASEVFLITDSIRQPAIRIGTTWRTHRPMNITLGIATGNTRIWVLIKGPNFKRTVPPKVALNLRGIAAVETDGQDHTEMKWKLLSKHRPLNRAAGIGKARIFTPAGTSEICEGLCSVTKRTSRAIDLRELHGWGDPLITRPRESGEPALACSVEDHGCVDLFLGTLGHKAFNTLYRRTPQVPGKDHSVFAWSALHNAPRVISKDNIRSDPQGFAWALPELGQVAALAIAYQGSCLGSYWNSSYISAGINQTRSTEGFALVRWLRIPVLNHTFRHQVQQAVSRAPVEFVRGWLGKNALPPGLGQRLAEQGLDTVIRALLWNHVEPNESRASLLVRAFPRSLAEGEIENEADQFKRTLVHVGGICPSVAYGFAKPRVRGEKYRKFVRTAAAEMLRQTSNELPQLHAALARLRRDCAGLIGLAPDDLQGALESYRRCLDGQVSDKRYEEHLRRLGEMVQGRQFLSAYLLMRLLDGVRP
jgi:hypothetical protein